MWRPAPRPISTTRIIILESNLRDSGNRKDLCSDLVRWSSEIGPLMASACQVDRPKSTFFFFFFFTLVTGPRRSLSLKLSDTRLYEPEIRTRLGKK
jgi:hypothetical protein